MPGDRRPWPEPCPGQSNGPGRAPGTQPTTLSFPFERIQTPTAVDLACAGFVSKQLVANANFVAGDLYTPSDTKNSNGEVVYLAGKGYEVGQKYTIVRELRDPNRYEIFAGQHTLLKTMGQPYSELARVRIIDTRSKMAIAEIEMSCDPVNPGDYVIPYVEKPAIAFHPPLRFDRFLTSSGKLTGRIAMAKDFDSEIGPGDKVYMNVGSNQGVKPGDYFRAVRTYEADVHDPVDSLSFKASTSEDTQAKQAVFEPNFLNKTGGPEIHVRDLPRRAVEKSWSFQPPRRPLRAWSSSPWKACTLAMVWNWTSRNLAPETIGRS